MQFEVSMQKFSGPLDLLLELIEKEDLPITDIALAKVTEDYLRHINENNTLPEELADFLIVATKLLLIKSRAILPLPIEDEEEGPDLADQLKMYREFIEASKIIQKIFDSQTEMFPRQKPFVIKSVEFQPPKEVDANVLHIAFGGLLKKLEPFFELQRASVERIVSVQERINHIREALLERSRMSFRDVIKGAKTKVEVVTSFLALLELVKQKTIHVMQQDRFDDIMIKHIE
ncbi:MAG: segregation/condensation protein A [Patescibacteria group bacterium]